MATLQSQIRVGENVVFQNLGDEAIILNLDTGEYYGLDVVGMRMWLLLAEHGEVEPAFRALLDIYDVAAEELQQDILRLVDDLAAHRLVQVA